MKKLLIAFLILTLSLSIFSTGICEETADESAAKSVVTKYYTALAAEDYQGAYNLLTKLSQEYYGTLDNYISTFTVTGMDIKDYKIYRVKTADTAIVTKTMVNYSMAGALFAEPVEDTTSYKDVLIKENGNWRIDAHYGPYKSVVVNAKGESRGLEVIIYAIDFYPDLVTVNLSFNNIGKRKISLLPYNKNTLLCYDDKKLTTVELPYILDHNLYSGVTLEPETRALGFINFLGGVPRDEKNIDLVIQGITDMEATREDGTPWITIEIDDINVE